ncbi:MAG: YdeI/OmpD-associated family protein [Leadbetterella sp.]
METYKNTPTFYAHDRAAWRKWLLENHTKEKAVWLIIYKKESHKSSIYYPEAVDESLCFGWIDSLPNKRDEESYYQFFSVRKPKSNWSKVNKDKVANLLEAGLIHESGQKAIDLAKQNGTWDALNEVENLVIPNEMQILLNENKKALENWDAFPKSTKRGILEWILNAKTPETKSKRINETVRLASENIRANQYNPDQAKKLGG